MQTIDQAADRIITNLETNQPQNGRGLAKATDSPPSTSLRKPEVTKSQLAAMLSRVCLLQKQYGKTKDELEDLIEGFAWLLKGYNAAAVADAFRAYLKTHSDIPAPADIIAEIENQAKQARNSITNVMKPTVEKLAEYYQKGIRLMPLQIEELKAAGYTID